MKHWVEFIRADTRKIKLYLSNVTCNNVEFPSTNSTFFYRKTLYPNSLETFLNGNAIRVDYKGLIVSNTTCIVNVIASQSKYEYPVYLIWK